MHYLEFILGVLTLFVSYAPIYIIIGFVIIKIQHYENTIGEKIMGRFQPRKYENETIQELVDKIRETSYGCSLMADCLLSVCKDQEHLNYVLQWGKHLLEGK